MHRKTCFGMSELFAEATRRGATVRVKGLESCSTHWHRVILAVATVPTIRSRDRCPFYCFDRERSDPDFDPALAVAREQNRSAVTRQHRSPLGGTRRSTYQLIQREHRQVQRSFLIAAKDHSMQGFVFVSVESLSVQPAGVTLNDVHQQSSIGQRVRGRCQRGRFRF